MTHRNSELGGTTYECNPIKSYYAKGGRKAAINAFCSHCVGCTAKEQGNGQIDHLEAGFRNLVRNCTATGCPLYGYRPYQQAWVSNV